MSDTNLYGQPLSLRRNRQSNVVRELVRTVHVQATQMIQPLFVVEGISEREAVAGLGDSYRDTPTTLLKQIESDVACGVNKFLLFVVPAHKHENHFDQSFAKAQIAAIKKAFPQIWLAVDVCLCSSTTHGHCGVMNDVGSAVDNTRSTDALAHMALAFAGAGADCVAPSDMMDGRIKAVRNILDDHDLHHVMIMAYSAKFASNFYGPFRLACKSAPASSFQLHDRKTYQIDFNNRHDALQCAKRDAAEGADILMVKPALAYLDIVQSLAQEFTLPIAAYHVSGEYAMIELAAEKQLLNKAKAHLETWSALKRAGCDIIITYAARHARQWLSEYDQ